MIERQEVRSVYQPIVRLYSRVIAYEALARGPAGLGARTPRRPLRGRPRQGLETALDWECWRAALRGGIEGGLDPTGRSSSTSSLLGRPWVPEIGDPLLEDALDRFPLVVELTERALPNHATDLIPLAEDLRRRGARIALDDVGTDPRSLALMPFLRPDVIKLDLKLMHNSPSRGDRRGRPRGQRRGGADRRADPRRGDRDRGPPAAGAGARRLLRPGLALRATGRARPRAGPLGAISRRRANLHEERAPRSRSSPRKRPLRRADKRLLLQLSLSIERQIANQASSAVIISTFQHAETSPPRPPAATPSWPRRGAGRRGRGRTSRTTGPGCAASRWTRRALRDEWDVTVLGPHFGAAFVARDLGDNGPDMERRFDFAMTHDRDLVTEVARSMMRRLAAV